MGKQSKRRNDNRLAKQMLEASHQTVEEQQPVEQEQKTKPMQQQPDPVSTKPAPKRKRITFDVSSELHRKAFLHSRRQGTTIKDLLTNFLERETINEKI